MEHHVNEILERNGMHNPPIDPIVIANRENVEVYTAKFEDEDTSGAILRNDDGDFEILVNKFDSEKRRRFTVAHELGHFILHGGDDFYDSKDILFRSVSQMDISENDRRKEVQANMFAAELLMPRGRGLGRSCQDFFRIASSDWSPCFQRN